MENLQKSRFNMIHQQIKPYAVSDNQILELMNKVPRENFVPKGFETVAYTDTAIPLGDEHFMLQPKIIARALQALDIKKNESVLEIGAGTGYVTTLLSSLAAQVYSTEIEPSLFKSAAKNVQSCSNVTLVNSDAAMGWEQHAPYHIIFISGSYPIEIPSRLTEQLTLGGRCFAVIGKHPAMQACLFTKTNQGVVKEALFETCTPALTNAPSNPLFTF